jgi:oligoendopeptidase F
MFVYALYQKYKQEGKAFVPKFKKALTAGSSISPAAIARTMDLDVTTRSFWNLGMKTYKSFLTELEDLVKTS